MDTMYGRPLVFLSVTSVFCLISIPSIYKHMRFKLKREIIIELTINMSSAFSKTVQSERCSSHKRHKISSTIQQINCYFDVYNWFVKTTTI
jgi:hypothetical protein